MSWREIGYFAAHRLIGSRVSEYYNEFLELHRSSPERIEALREQRLGEILAHAAQQIP